MMEKADFPNKTYYDILGVAQSATQDEIKQAYRKVAREHHPDVVTNDTAILSRMESQDLSKTRAFKIVTFAYNTLKDPELRAEYDRSLIPESDFKPTVSAQEVGHRLRTRHRDPNLRFGSIVQEDEDAAVTSTSVMKMMKRKSIWTRLRELFG